MKKETAQKYNEHLQVESGSFACYIYFHMAKLVMLMMSYNPSAGIEEGAITMTLIIKHRCFIWLFKD